MRALTPRTLAAGGLAAVGIVVTLVVTAPARSGSARPSIQPPTTDDPACVVAHWDSARHTLTLADVRALAATIAPAPTGDEAKRWALDVHLAAWDRGVTGSPRELLAAHRAWLGEHGVDPFSQQGPTMRPCSPARRWWPVPVTPPLTECGAFRP